MKTFTVATLAACLTAVSSMPSYKAPKGHEYQAPGKGDVRSPCPGLNSMANHGYLPRNGKDITIPMLNKAGLESLNVGHTFMTPIALLGFQARHADTLSLDLNDLNEHDFPIEHDASLSRQDRYFGNDHIPIPRSYDMFFDAFNGAKYTTLKSAAAAKYVRVNDSLVNNPKVAYGPRELILSYGETALYLQTMGNSSTSGVARIDYIRDFLTHDRLPYHLGWTPSPESITLASVGAMTFELQPLSPHFGDTTIYAIAPGSYEDFLEGKLILESELCKLGVKSKC